MSYLLHVSFIVLFSLTGQSSIDRQARDASRDLALASPPARDLYQILPGAEHIRLKPTWRGVPPLTTQRLWPAWRPFCCSNSANNGTDNSAQRRNYNHCPIVRARCDNSFSSSVAKCRNRRHNSRCWQLHRLRKQHRKWRPLQQRRWHQHHQLQQWQQRPNKQYQRQQQPRLQQRQQRHQWQQKRRRRHRHQQ